MLRKIATFVIVLPLAAIIIAFAVANRHAVTVSFDPFSAAAPAYAPTVPLFVLIFVLLITGVIVGGAAAWLRQAKWRRVARRLDGENRRLMADLSVTRERLATETQRAATAEAAAREVVQRVERGPDTVPAIAPPSGGV